MSGPQLQSLDTELQRLRALVEVSRLVFSSLELDALLDNILHAATTTVGAARGTVYLYDEVRRELWSRVSSGSERVEIRLPFGQGMAGHTAETGEVLLVDDVYQSPFFNAETDRRTGFHTRNALCVPIRERTGRTVAVLQLLNKDGGFTNADTEFLDLMGVHISQALANAQAQQVLLERQRLLKEVELAARIQRLLLPAYLPALPHLELDGRMLPSRRIAGDYYDVVPLDGGRNLVVLADVSGKGVPAALVMSNVQAALWATIALGSDVELWAQTLSELLYRRLDGSRYVTAFLLVLEPDGRSGRYVNAGHPPALLRSRDTTVRLDSTGPPLGMLGGASFPSARVEILAGSTLLVYSDGLTEADDGEGNELGVDGLEEVLRHTVNDGDDAVTTADRILARIEEWADAGEEADDRTLLVVRSLP